MKRFVRHWMVLCTIFTIFFMIGPEITSAEEYFMIQGKVVGIYKDQLTVKTDKGETMYFAIGRKTVFVPTRQPGVDEHVKVTYYFQRGGSCEARVMWPLRLKSSLKSDWRQGRP